MMPASMPLSVMLKLGKLITPKTDVVTLTLEEFSVTDMISSKGFHYRKKNLQAGPFAMHTRQMHCLEFRMESMY